MLAVLMHLLPRSKVGSFLWVTCHTSVADLPLFAFDPLLPSFTCYYPPDPYCSLRHCCPGRLCTGTCCEALALTLDVRSRMARDILLPEIGSLHHHREVFQDVQITPRKQGQASRRFLRRKKIQSQNVGVNRPRRRATVPPKKENLGLYLNKGPKYSGVGSQVFPGWGYSFLSLVEEGFPCRNCHGNTASADFS